MAAVQVPGTQAPANGAGAPAAGVTPEASDSGSGGSEAELMAKALSVLETDDGSTPEADTEEAKTKEAPKKEKEPEKAPDEVELSKAFAALTAKERRFNERKAEQHSKFQEREATLTAREKSAEASEKEFKEWRSHAQKSPLEALKMAGWSYDQLVEYVMKDGSIPADKLQADFKIQLDEEAKKLRSEHEEIKKGLESDRREQQRMADVRFARSYEERVSQELDELYKSEPEKFSSSIRIPRPKVLAKVLDKMISHYRETAEKSDDRRGEVLALSDALLYAEREAQEVAGWFTAKPAASQGGTVESGNPGAVKPESEARPISQRESSVRGHRSVDPDNMTEEERSAEALRILTGDE